VSWYFVGGVILPSGSLILKSALTMLPAAVLALLGSRIWKASNFLGVFLTLRITSLVLSFASVFKFLVSRGLVGALALSLGGSLGLALSLGWPVTCTAMTPAISKPAANRRTTGPGRKNPVTSLHLVVRGHIILKGESRKQAVHARFRVGDPERRQRVSLPHHLVTVGWVVQGYFAPAGKDFFLPSREFSSQGSLAIRRDVGATGDNSLARLQALTHGGRALDMISQNFPGGKNAPGATNRNGRGARGCRADDRRRIRGCGSW